MVTKTAARLTLSVGERDHIKGRPNAPVTLVEYGDYECPYCGQAYFVIKEIERTFARVVRFVFRNFPLTSVHPHAERAAEAAECAGAQDKFWEMHDCLFEHQDALGDRHLVDYAALVKLDIVQFNRDMIERRYLSRVREDFLSGVRSGVNGTPTFFINGFRYDGSLDLESLSSAIAYAAKEEKR